MVPDTIRTEWVWQIGGSDFAVNVLHYTTGATDPLVQANVTAFGSEVLGLWTSTNIKTRYSNAVALNRIICRDLRTDGNGPLQTAVSLVGTGVTNPLPPQDCIVTTLRTTNGSRRGRGRIYWPGDGAGFTTAAGLVSSTTLTAISGWMDGLLSVSMGTLGAVVLGVYSRSDDVTRTVTAHSTDAVYDVQTRRRDLSIV